MMLKVFWWLALRGFATISGGIGYAIAAIEIPLPVRWLQRTSNQIEDLVIESSPTEYQAIAGALGIGDGLPLLIFVGLALVAVSTICNIFGRSMQLRPKKVQANSH